MTNPPTQEHPEIIFRRQYRDQWNAFLNSPAGACFLQLVYVQKPNATPSTLPHQDSHRLGQIMMFDQFIELLFLKMKNQFPPPKSDIAQDYPDEPEPKPQE